MLYKGLQKLFNKLYYYNIYLGAGDANIVSDNDNNTVLYIEYNTILINYYILLYNINVIFVYN